MIFKKSCKKAMHSICTHNFGPTSSSTFPSWNLPSLHSVNPFLKIFSTFWSFWYKFCNLNSSLKYVKYEHVQLSCLALNVRGLRECFWCVIKLSLCYCCQKFNLALCNDVVGNFRFSTYF